jgi:hypothetical protein
MISNTHGLALTAKYAGIGIMEKNTLRTLAPLRRLLNDIPMGKSIGRTNLHAS